MHINSYSSVLTFYDEYSRERDRVFMLSTRFDGTRKHTHTLVLINTTLFILCWKLRCKCMKWIASSSHGKSKAVPSHSILWTLPIWRIINCAQCSGSLQRSNNKQQQHRYLAQTRARTFYYGKNALYCLLVWTVNIVCDNYTESHVNAIQNQWTSTDILW